MSKYLSIQFIDSNSYNSLSIPEFTLDDYNTHNI